MASVCWIRAVVLIPVAGLLDGVTLREALRQLYYRRDQEPREESHCDEQHRQPE